MAKYDYIIVGTGICGCILANLLKEKDKKVLLVDRDIHIGGVCYSERIDGVEVHKYGPHIYRTDKIENWNYFNKFSPFNSFINEPIAVYHNSLYNLPFNMNTFHQMWSDVITPEDAKKRIDEERQKANIQNPEENLETKALSLIGQTIYERLIKEYTEKQWGRPCSELPARIISVLPVRFTYNNNYFSQKYQGIPILGYTKMLKNMIEGIDLQLDYNIKDINDPIFDEADYVIYTGRLDTLLHNCLGTLPYRGAVFKIKTYYGIDNYQGVAVMNFTSKDVPFIRRTEHKHFIGETPESSGLTVISEEYSIDATNDPECSYYPIMNLENIELQKKYKELLPKNFFTCGVNGDYAPYTMDTTLDACVKLVESLT